MNYWGQVKSCHFAGELLGTGKELSILSKKTVEKKEIAIVSNIIYLLRVGLKYILPQLKINGVVFKETITIERHVKG